MKSEKRQARDTQGAATLAWCLLWLLGRIPLWCIYPPGKILGRLLYALDSKSCKITRINIAHCYGEMPARSQEKLVRQCMIEHGLRLALAPAILTRSAGLLEGMITRLEGRQALFKAMDKGPVVLLNAHMGAFLLCGCIPAFAVTWFTQQQQGVFESVCEKRRKSLFAYVYTDISGVRKAVKELKQGKAVGILCDHDPGKQGRLLARFFDQPVFSSTLPAKLIGKSRARVFFYISVRDRRALGFRLRVIPAEADIYHQDADIATQAINDQLEKIVRSSPADFDWSYERFRRASRHLYKTLKKDHASS